MAAIALSLMLFFALANVVMIAAALGATRSAVLEGARRGASEVGTVADCQAVANDRLNIVPWLNTVSITCQDTGRTMVAQATGSIRPPVEIPLISGWIPDFDAGERAIIIKERIE